jgi:hypothetical protein
MQGYVDFKKEYGNISYGILDHKKCKNDYCKCNIRYRKIKHK